ncbi:MAG: ferrochelatase [Firmicutes bacterium]|nr:ferrochelatase [Bacillota bacterium]
MLRYYTHIRHGRPPQPEQLEALSARYRAIGGLSPLYAVSRDQAQGLQDRLDRKYGKEAVPVALGFKHAPPFIADGVQELVRNGVQRIIGLVLAPHYSTMSVGEYFHDAKEAAAQTGADVSFEGIASWHLQPELIELWGRRVEAGLQQFDAAARGDVEVIFTAHALPERITAMHDPYVDQLHASGEAVAALLHLPHYRFAWQSAGRTPEPWLGPDIAEVIQTVRDAGRNHVLVCPLGFVADHLEILYDLDIALQERAAALHMQVKRTASFNADPQFLDVLAAVVQPVIDGYAKDARHG